MTVMIIDDHDWLLTITALNSSDIRLLLILLNNDVWVSGKQLLVDGVAFTVYSLACLLIKTRVIVGLARTQKLRRGLCRPNVLETIPINSATQNENLLHRLRETTLAPLLVLVVFNILVNARCLAYRVLLSLASLLIFIEEENRQLRWLLYLNRLLIGSDECRWTLPAMLLVFLWGSLLAWTLVCLDRLRDIAFLHDEHCLLLLRSLGSAIDLHWVWGVHQGWLQTRWVVWLPRRWDEKVSLNSNLLAIFDRLWSITFIKILDAFRWVFKVLQVIVPLVLINQKLLTSHSRSLLWK